LLNIKITSQLVFIDIEAEITKYHEALLAISADSEESGVSDTEAPYIFTI